MELQNVDNRILSLLERVHDPEIPVLSILDLGIVRGVEMNGQAVTVRITPTYSGCPAMDMIADDIKSALSENGFETTVETVLAPAWTTDWLSDAGRAKLAAYGIAAPLDATSDKKALLLGARIVRCTRCGSQNTRMISQFGSTACKALFQCDDCLEPFDYFKCL